MNRLRYLARHLKLLALDVDGVLTDGRLYFTEDGTELKTFDTQDGHGIKMLQQAGVTCAIITGRNTRLVQRRAENLGIEHVIQGREDKHSALQELLSTLNIAPEHCAYVGDDLPDLAAIEMAGLGVAVANAHPTLKIHADLVTESFGGRGAVRELCDFILDAKGLMEEIVARYRYKDA